MRIRRVQIWRAVVYLRSGDYFTLVAENIMTKSRGGVCAEISWDRLQQGRRPLFVNFTDVSAVVVRPYGHKWRRQGKSS